MGCAALLLAVAMRGSGAQGGRRAGVAAPACGRVVFEGDVRAGEGFEKIFARGLKFSLEPLRSGWIVRVLPTDEGRGAHDFAELATPPYRSVSPLLIGTDWSFRAQDAVAWNPRRFRYAGDRAAFRRLAGLYDGVMANDVASSVKAAELASQQPEGVLKILDARLAPGVADQAGTAATVASHLEETPHAVDQSVTPTPLGAIEAMRFRVELNLAPGVEAAKGIRSEKIPCDAPTSSGAGASQQRNE
jgi:hypothetical protein